MIADRPCCATEYPTPRGADTGTPLRNPAAASKGETSARMSAINAIESLNARFRRAVNARGHFPNEQAAMKVLYLTVISLDPAGRGRQRWSNRWKAALNAFEMTFDGRLSAGRN